MVLDAAFAAYGLLGLVVTVFINPGPAVGRFARLLAQVPAIAAVFQNQFLAERRLRVLLEFGANVVLFAPLGFLVCARWPRLRTYHVLLCGFALSAVIEGFQLLAHAGRKPDVRDLISNIIGTGVGALICRRLFNDSGTHVKAL